MKNLLSPYKEVWFCDFEYKADDGERPIAHCMVAHELWTGRKLKLWADELGKEPPFSAGPESLFVAYNTPAEFSCFLVLGWKLPLRILDLYAEFCCHTNGIPPRTGRKLLGALAYHGIDCMEAAIKKENQDLAIRGGPFTLAEKRELLDYCEEDVLVLPKLLAAMASKIDLGRALLRGRYMAAVSRMIHTGTPIDTETLQNFRACWGAIKNELIERVDSSYGIYQGTTFKMDRFAKWLELNDIPWPRLLTGVLKTDRDTFKDMSKLYPVLAPIRELRQTLGELRLESLCVGADGRNRTFLFPFGSKSGRNAPGNSKFIFGPSCWLRGLIKPEPGRALAYVDYGQQEFGIVAALSGDKAMMEAYRSGDPYLAFAKQAGAVAPRSRKP